MAKLNSITVGFLTVVILHCSLSVNAYPEETPTAKDSAHPCTKKLPSSIWKYTVKLLKNLKNEGTPDDNILVSPFNTYLSLSSLYLGAGERTRKDLAKILELPENDNELSNSNLHQLLSHMVESLQHKNESLFKLGLANGLFLKKSITIKDSYLSAAKKYYDATASNVDFQTAEATDTINKWVSEKTVNRISKFYDNPISPDTIATLVSTLYFKAKWKHPFSEDQTKQETFNIGTAEIKIPLMNNVEFVGYLSDPSLQIDAISLPYAGNEFSMTIVLPHKSQTLNNVTDHLHLLNPYKFSQALQSTYVDYKIPKMKFSWKRSLVNSLNASAIFDNPDLSELTTSAVKVSKMIHASEFEVDEEGTVASAVTAIEAVLQSYQVSLSKPVQFYVNRPFLVAIIHRPTCTVLFMAQVQKPI